MLCIRLWEMVRRMQVNRHQKGKSLSINVILNMFRTFMNIAFPLITYPYVTRVLGVENLGKYNFASSIIGYLTLISAFGISSYAIREGARLRNSREQENVFVNQMFTIGMITTLLSYVIMIILCGMRSVEPYKYLIYIQSLSLIGNAVGIEWLNSVYEDFVYITIRSLAFQILSIILMFVFVKSENGLYIYAFICVLAGIGGYVCNYLHSKKYVHVRLTKNVELKKHLRPLLFFFFSNLTTTIFVNSDQTMLGLLSGDYYVGIYAVAVKIYNILKNIFTSILVVVMPRVCILSGQDEDESQHELSEMILKMILIIVIPMAVGIYLTSEKVVLIVAGAEYIEGVSALKILALSVLAAALASYMTYIYIVPGAFDKILLMGSTVSAFINVVLNLFMIPVWKHNGAAFTTLISELVVFAIEWMYVKPKLDHRRVFKTCIQSVASCTFMALTIYLLDRLRCNIVLLLFLEVCAGVIGYCACMIIFRNEMVMYGLKKLQRK